MKVFDCIDFNIIRVAKASAVVCKEVTSKVVLLDVDDVEVLVKKDSEGFIDIRCACEFCGKKGIANYLLCRRQIQVINWLIKRSGHVSELDIDKKILEKKYRR